MGVIFGVFSDFWKPSFLFLCYNFLWAELSQHLVTGFDSSSNDISWPILGCNSPHMVGPYSISLLAPNPQKSPCHLDPENKIIIHLGFGGARFNGIAILSWFKLFRGSWPHFIQILGHHFLWVGLNKNIFQPYFRTPNSGSIDIVWPILLFTEHWEK